MTAMRTLRLQNVLWNVYAFFTPYVHPFERKTERFFRWMRAGRNQRDIEKRLTALMQENLIIFSVWVEKRFKNYKYLTKRTRRKLYTNAVKIEADFAKFVNTYRAKHSSKIAGAEGDWATHIPAEQLHYVSALAAYFDPHTRFEYQPSSSFGKLLVDPVQTASPSSPAHMVGDCNQIVTLYTHLWARAFPVTLLNIKLIPGHVCLHLDGIDIEATNGTLTHYGKFEAIGPITELVSTNMLDINDPRESVRAIEPAVFVKGAQLALAISSKKNLVEHNMRSAYHNLGLRALEEKDYKKALFYSARAGSEPLKKAILGRQYNELVQKVKQVKTISDAKKYKEVYKKMQRLARDMRDDERLKEIEKILTQIT